METTVYSAGQGFGHGAPTNMLTDKESQSLLLALHKSCAA